MRSRFRFLKIGALLLACSWPVLAQDLPEGPQDLLAPAIAKVADGRKLEAADLLLEVLRELPREHPVSKDARVLFCQLRGDLPEAASAFQLDLLQGEAGGESRAAERLLAPDAHMEQHGCLYMQGAVLVEVTVDPYGCVVATRLLKGMLARVDEAAVATLERWVYLPAISNGKAVASRFIERGRVGPGPQLSFYSTKDKS